MASLPVIAASSDSIWSISDPGIHGAIPLTDMEPKQEDESEDGASQTDLEEEAKPNRWQCPQNWEAIMEEAEGLAYDDLRSDSDATVMGVDSP